MVLRWRDKAFWFEDTLSVVRELHSQGYQLAIMSNSWLGLTEKRDNDQLPKELKLFKHIFDSSQAGMKKPDERFYELVESGLKSTGNDIMLVDDSLNNAVPASKRGWQFFHYVTENDACAGSTQKLRALLK
jgi:HAD superfamily hydrolase (TIGR01509 family)